MELGSAKKFKKIDVIILLGSLLIFSCSIGLLHAQDADDDTEETSEITSEMLFREIGSLLESDNSLESAKFISQFPDQLIEILNKILEVEKVYFTRDDKIRFVFELADRITDQQLLEEIFITLISKEKLLYGTPILYIGVANGKKEPQSIKPFIIWANSYLKKNPSASQSIKDVLQSCELAALEYAVAHNKFKIARKLFQAGASLDKTHINHLLLLAVAKEVSPRFIPLLKKQGADLNTEYTHHKGVTPLIRAVDADNKEMVITLIKAGAQVNLIKDPAIGSALQHAIQLRNVEMDRLLRSYGAREEL